MGGFIIHSNIHDAQAAADGNQEAIQKAIPLEIKSKKPQPQEDKAQSINFKLPNFQWVAIILGAILLIKFTPSQQITTNGPLESIPTMGHETTISGKIITKQINDTGGLKLVINDQFHNQQYKVIVSPDIIADVHLIPGTLIRLTGNPLGDNIFTVSDPHKIQELTSIVNFDSINNVFVKNGRATFQYGGAITHLSMPGLPDGSYSQIIFAQDNKGQIQVLQTNQ